MPNKPTLRDEREFKNKYLGEWPSGLLEKHDTDWPECRRCHEKNPSVKQDWPLKGLCWECVSLEQKMHGQMEDKQ